MLDKLKKLVYTKNAVNLVLLLILLSLAVVVVGLLINTAMKQTSLGKLESKLFKRRSLDSIPPVKSNSIQSNEIENFKDPVNLDKLMCSKDCCGNQWPVSHDSQRDPRIPSGALGSELMPTNITCSGGKPGDEGSGCVCMTTETRDYLADRGGNNSFTCSF